MCDSDAAAFKHPSGGDMSSSSWPQSAKNADHNNPPPEPPEECNMSITLNEFVESHSESLPCEIMVVEGASTSPVALSNEDILNVHRICNENMMLARANENQQYLVPLNAAVEFCVLYDPESNISKALKGYSFEKVSDLMSAEVKPKLVCARSSWEDKETNKVVISNREVFVVRDIVQTKKKKKKKFLKLYSITKLTEKIVPEECVADFSTKPSLIPLYLTEIAEYIPDPFPCKAVLHDEGLMVPPHLCTVISNLSGLILTLVSISNQRVLKATYKRDGIENPIIMDIPVELPQVRVKVLHVTSQYEDMRACNETGDQKPAVDENKVDQVAKDEEPYEVMFSRTDQNSSPKNTLEIWSQELNKLPVKQPLPGPKPELLRPDQFAEQYGHSLPMQVKIAEISQSVSERGLCADEVYNVHFVTATEGISMMVDKAGLVTFVPTDSSAQFGVIFNPQGDLDVAVSGYTFETVEDVVRYVLLPRVLCATQRYAPPSGSASSVDSGEILIVKDAEISPESNRPVLLVYSVGDQADKWLQAECDGRFVTDPSCIKLDASVIVRHLTHLFPTCAMMYPGHSTDAISGATMVTLLQYHPKSVLVATAVRSSKSAENVYQPVEIPLDAAVKLVPIRSGAAVEAPSCGPRPPNYAMKSETLVQGTATFAPPLVLPPIVPRRRLKAVKNKGVPPIAAARFRKANSAVYFAADRWSRNSSVFQGQEEIGPEVKTVSDAVTHEVPLAAEKCKPQAAPTCNVSPMSLVEESEVEEQRNSVFRQDEKPAANPDKLEALAHDVAELVKQFSELAKQIGNVEKKLDATNDLLRMRDLVSVEERREKRKFVESLTLQQVLQLLHASGLGAYAESFDREKIDGQTLCTLNASVLQQELNVSSELHRLKLMGILSGALDIRSFFAYPSR